MDPDPDPDATVIRPAAAAAATAVAAAAAAAEAAATAAAAADPDATVVRAVHLATRRDDPDATVIVAPRAPRAAPAPAPARSALPALPRRATLSLAPGLRLHEYRIARVIGQGGFGITYLATDVHLNAQVAIKEYLPEAIAFRAGDRSVHPAASGHRDRYRQGLESFLVEARTLATFRHPAIVRVARFFEAHRTAYMVMEYERGSPFKVWWPVHAGIGEAGLIERLLPLLDGLAVVHAAGFLHRDIKPDNIQVRARDGSLVLLDFGSAGQTVAVAGQGAVVLTPGYAPIEQYGLGQQGAWTDLYALAATLYWAVTGAKPPDAEMRAVVPAAMAAAADAGRGRYGSAFLQAIDWALHTDPARRPQTVADFRRALCADHLASLGLQEALQRGDDSTLEGGPASEAPASRERVTARLRRALRALATPRDWPLVLKMSLALVAAALLPMVLTGAYNLRVSLAAVSAAETRFVADLAQSTAGRLGQFIGDSRHLARAAATDAELVAWLADPQPAARAELDRKLARLVQSDPDVDQILLADAQGSVLLCSDPALEGRSLAARHDVQEALAGRPYTSTLIVGAAAGAPGMWRAEPVRGGDGRVIGALVVDMRGKAVAAILGEVRHDASLTPLLIDGDGVVIYHPRAERLYHSLVPLPPGRTAEIVAERRFGGDRVESLGEFELARAMLGAQSAGTVGYTSAVDQSQEIAGYAPVPGHDWVVGVTEPRARFEAPMQKLYRTLLWSVALVGLLFVGLALRIARGIVRPIRALTDAANALKAGDYGAAAVTVTSRDEVGQLGRTFNVMIDVLRQRERERRRE